MTGQASLLALQANPILLGERLFLEVVIVVDGLHRILEIRRIRRELKQGIGVVGVSDEIEVIAVAALPPRATPAAATTSGTGFVRLRGSGLIVLGSDLAGLFSGGGAGLLSSLLSRFGVVLRPSRLTATSSPTPAAAAATRGSL